MVLWFTNQPLPQVAAAAGLGSSGFGGHWMTALVNPVSAPPDLILGDVTEYPRFRNVAFEEAGVYYYTVGQRNRTAAVRQQFGEACLVPPCDPGN